MMRAPGVDRIEQHLAFPAPQSREGWRRLVDDALKQTPCVYHRNLEISSLYAWLYLRHPKLFKWAGMAAFASHHARVALRPLALHKNEAGAVPIHEARERFGMTHIDRVRQVNNAIFEDIFWAHLAYDGTEEGFARTAAMLKDAPHGMGMLEGFAVIEEGRRQNDPDRVWEGNVKLLWHEQAAVVQPRFDTFSRGFARTFSMLANINFEASGWRERAGFFTSFYGHMVLRQMPLLWTTKRPPRLTRLDHRWRWVERAVVPRFRKLDEWGRVEPKLKHILAESRRYHETTFCEAGDLPSA